MTTPPTMKGRRLIRMANDPEAARRWPTESGNYWELEETDTDLGTAEVLHLGHRLNDAYDPAAHSTGWGYPARWSWCAYAVWPKGEQQQGAPGIYEWVMAAPGTETRRWAGHGGGTWLVNGEPYPTRRDAVTAALALARSRSDRA